MNAGWLGVWAGVVIGSFVIGAINPATIVGRVLGKDLRSSGSGNPGATNAGRVLGAKWGVLVGLLDVAKGLVPTLVAGHFWGVHLAYAAGLAAVLGHIWSPFLHGRGGKGVATTLGAVLGVHPWLALVVVLAFGAIVAIWRRVSLGSVAGGVAMVGLAVWVWLGGFTGDRWTALWLLALGGVVLWRHRSNLKALWRQRRAR